MTEKPIDGAAEAANGPRRAMPSSRRIYVWWGVAIALLLASVFICWRVVVPAWQAHHVLGKHNSRVQLAGRDVFFPPSAPYVAELGGPGPAARKLAVYLRAPEWGFKRRQWAMHLLAGCGRPAIPALADMLDHPDLAERAATHLYFFGPDAAAAFPALMRALNSERRGLRTAASRALGAIGPAARPAAPLLTERMIRLHGENSDEREAAALALHGMGIDTVPLLRRLLLDRRVDSRLFAVQQLGCLAAEDAPGADAALPDLLRLLSDRDIKVRRWSAWTLGMFGRRAASAVAALQALCDSEDEELRLNAADSLRRIRNEIRSKEE